MNQEYELTSLQQGMVYQSFLGEKPVAAGYNIEQLVFEIPSNLSRDSLSQALAQLLQIHPALTASFYYDPGNTGTNIAPHQQFNHQVICPVEDLDLQTDKDVDYPLYLSEFLASDRQRGFELGSPPLMRCSLIHRPGHDNNLIVWTIHHILLDGRSIVELVSQFVNLLGSDDSATGNQSVEIDNRYSEYLRWVAEQNTQEGVDYFAELLDGKTSPTPLPLAGHPSDSLLSTEFGELALISSAELAQAANNLAKASSTTLATVLQAMWALVLTRHTGDFDVVFGNTRAGRAAYPGELADAVGLFINTLPLRASTDHHWQLSDLLLQLRSQTLAVRPYETTPLSEVARATKFSGATLLFETLFVFEQKSLHSLLKEQNPYFWEHREFHLYEQPSIPLTLTASGGDKLELRMLYDKARFTEETIERLLQCCEHALKEMVRGADQSLGDISVLSDQQREQIVNSWNATEREFSDQIAIQQLFEQRAELQPKAIALEVAGQNMTYEMLENQANQLANLLVARGVQPGDHVALCLSRNFDLVISLLAIVKAGAAYIPLDPAYPVDRLEVMIGDTEARLVITHKQFASLFNIETIILDAEHRDDWQASSAVRPNVEIDSEATCYTIFTSGSTGKPKGVVLSHKAVVNTLEWVNREFQMSPADRLLFVTSPCFDLSVYDIFGMLGAGGTLVIATEDLLAEPGPLASYVVEAGISVWNSAPAALQRLVPFFPAGEHPSLRICMLSGDWIPLTLPEAMWQLFPNVQMKSLGGATEAAIWSNWFDIHGINPRWASIPYGRPIQNCRYYVLDDRLEPVPIGVAGDLYIGGTCLARGYLKSPELTAERFIPDPLKPNSGERLYKTGDLARYFPDGNLEFLGRSDFQIKIRGYRIEMGEVEAIIEQLDGVQVAVCTAFGNVSEQSALYAYVVLKGTSELNEQAIKNHLAGKLPSFMIPARILLLPELPTTANGKLDRNALPDPREHDKKEVFIAPEGDIEKSLVAIWCDLLQVKLVCVEDNFFDLGGHSLLAVMLMGRIKREFEIELPMTTILSRPTIRGLAIEINKNAGVSQSKNNLQVFNEHGTKMPLLLLPGARGTAYTYRSLPEILGNDQPIYIIDLLSTHSDEHGHETVEQLADRFEQDVSQISQGKPIIVGGFSFGAVVAFELARRLKAKGIEVPLFISFDGFSPGFPYKLPRPEWIIAHMREFLKMNLNEKLDFISRQIDKRFRPGKLESNGKTLKANAPDQAIWAENEQTPFPIITKDEARNGYLPETRGLDLSMLLIRSQQNWNLYTKNMEDTLFGWTRYIGGPVTLIKVPGDHLGIWQDDKNSQRIAKIIEEHTRIMAQKYV